MKADGPSAPRAGSDQHKLEGPAPDDAPAEAREHRPALAPIGRVSFRAGRLAAVGIGRAFPQAHEIEHIDRAGPVVGAKFGEGFLGGIDVAGHARFSASRLSAGWPAALRAITDFDAKPEPPPRGQGVAVVCESAMSAREVAEALMWNAA